MKVKGGKDQEIAQLDRKSYFKNRDGRNTKLTIRTQLFKINDMNIINTMLFLLIKSENTLHCIYQQK